MGAEADNAGCGCRDDLLIFIIRQQLSACFIDKAEISRLNSGSAVSFADCQKILIMIMTVFCLVLDMSGIRFFMVVTGFLMLMIIFSCIMLMQASFLVLFMIMTGFSFIMEVICGLLRMVYMLLTVSSTLV